MKRALVGSLLLIACGGEDGRGGASASSLPVTFGSNSSATGGATESEGDPSGSPSGGTEGSVSGPSSGDDPSGPKFDIPEEPGADLPPTMMGCQKVDVLLAVDNSSSMQEEIDALAGPVFDDFPMQLLAINGGLLDFQLG